jgi:hypothetical protein
LYDLVLKFLVIRLEDSEIKRAMSREYTGDSDEKSANKKNEKSESTKEVSS